jgi:hypothetical protein
MAGGRSPSPHCIEHLFVAGGRSGVAGATTVEPVTTESPSVPNHTATRTESGISRATRYRCAACGNLTRFNVVTNRRTRAFHHFSVGGELSVEDVEVLDESVEEVSCRWCGNGNAIETIEDGAPEPK